MTINIPNIAPKYMKELNRTMQAVQKININSDRIIVNKVDTKK